MKKNESLSVLETNSELAPFLQEVWNNLTLEASDRIIHAFIINALSTFMRESLV